MSNGNITAALISSPTIQTRLRSERYWSRATHLQLNRPSTSAEDPVANGSGRILEGDGGWVRWERRRRKVAYEGMEINTLKHPSHVGVTHVVEWLKGEREHSSLQIPIWHTTYSWTNGNGTANMCLRSWSRRICIVKCLKNDMYTTIYSRANNFSKKSTHSKNNSFPPSQTPKP